MSAGFSQGVGFSPDPMVHALSHQVPANTGKNKIHAVAQEFESVFLTNMFENMFEGLDDDGPFGSGAGNGPWRSMLTEQYAKSVAANGGVGVAQQIERQLVSLQESHQ
jgi:Rod binding domain-containing protein